MQDNYISITTYLNLFNMRVSTWHDEIKKNFLFITYLKLKLESVNSKTIRIFLSSFFTESICCQY